MGLVRIKLAIDKINVGKGVPEAKMGSQAQSHHRVG